MKKLIAIAALSLAALPAFAADAPITGYVSDTKCAMASSKAKSAAEWIKPAAFEECVKTCLKDGSDAVFVTEDNKILTFDAASAEKIKPFLGRKVSVTGDVKDHTLKVATITGLKMP